MERWCIEMGFKPNDMDEFVKEFSKACQPGTKLIWKHIIKHTFPKKQAEIIKKQCLLHKLQTNHDTGKIEVPLKSIEDLNNYLKAKKDQEELKTLQNSIEVKKESVRNLLKKLKNSRETSINEEESLKEKAYKLSMLRKKKITIERNIMQLKHDIKFLKVINKESNKIVGFGPDLNDWERSVLMAVDELPDGQEYQTLLSKMSELLKSSNIAPEPSWDRTELLTEIETRLMSMMSKLKQLKVELDEEEIKLVNKKNEFTNHILQNCDDEVKKEDIENLISNYQQEFLQKIKEMNKEMLDTEQPYTLVMAGYNLRRAQAQIDEEVAEICALLPVENDDIEETPSYVVSTSDLPAELPIEKLKNSVSDEISLFMSLPLQKSSSLELNHVDLERTSESQLTKLNQDIKLLSSFMSLEENIRNISLLSTESLLPSHVHDETQKIFNKMPDCIRSITEDGTKVNEIYQRLKDAINFLRKDPLNEQLTGIDISGKDINYWLTKYNKTKKCLDHEKWVRSAIHKSDEPQS